MLVPLLTFPVIVSTNPDVGLCGEAKLTLLPDVGPERTNGSDKSKQLLGVVVKEAVLPDTVSGPL
jgi:hypothetical protein